MNKLIRYSVVAALLGGTCLFLLLSGYGEDNVAFAEPKGIQLTELQSEVPSLDAENLSFEGDDENVYRVQAVLSAQRTVVISGAMDGILEKVPFKNGDVFKKGDVLVQYNCRFERAKYREANAQLAITSRKAEAYENLKENDAVSDVEYVSILQEYERAQAVSEQVKSRLALCTIRAPFNGRVTDKVANTHEAARSGRVLMEVTSEDPLQAELLVPSVWLRWLNVGAELKIEVHETGRSYEAKIKRIHGKIDPVAQTAYVIAEVSKYEEELLPGMSGRAVFGGSKKETSNGFLGMKIEGYGKGN